jgi:CRISPR-associated protein Cas1
MMIVSWDWELLMDEADDSLLSVRSINEFIFCPRLFWLEEVAGEFEDNEHTIEGQEIHRNVDRPGGSMPPPDDDGQTPEWHTRSLWLSDDDLGVSGKIDLVELTDEATVMPVDYKKGTPDPDGEMWDTDRVQLLLQALLLRAQGYECDRVAVWYHGSRKRIEIEITEAMCDWARDAVEQASELYDSLKPPKPLEDSPKCRGCSLSGICQPDEVHALEHDHLAPDDELDDEIRRIVPPRDDAVPLYAHTQGAYVRKSGHCLKVDPPNGSDEEPTEVGLGRISQLNLMGSVQMSTQAMQTCLRNDVPVGYFSSSGWFYGLADPIERKQVHRRIAQHEAHKQQLADDIARAIVSDKIHNCRTLIRRNTDDTADSALGEMARCRKKAEACEDDEELLGIEGTAARAYWDAFDELVTEADEGFAMEGRNRRPPEDPVNALLSYAYAILTKDCTIAVRSVGLDPHLGLFHTSHHGRPALALDLMEIFRPLVVDSAVLRLVRRGDVSPSDFVDTGQSVSMKKAAKGALLREYERRMDSLVTHPVFGYRISYRRTLYVHARLLGRVLTGELDELPHFRNR